MSLLSALSCRQETVPELLEEAKEALDAVKTVSATVNQNGTITFTMSNGSTVTTTGESVIGSQGDDYVLTPQDKTDIANIVLQLLPTTQGVLYGNTSN